ATLGRRLDFAEAWPCAFLGCAGHDGRGMDQADVDHLERLLNAVRRHHDAAQGHAADGDYKRARHSLARLHALLDADAQRMVSTSNHVSSTFSRGCSRANS